MAKLVCFDLRPWAQKHRYRWSYEEGYGPGNIDDDPWFVEVICRYGKIYPYNSDMLLAYSNLGVKRKVRNISKLIEHHQWDGDAEVFRFPIEFLEQVAKILKPRRRRTLDPDKARAIGKATQFGAQSGPESQESTLDRG